ncbi:MAG: DUF2935 domain-containing protein [Oscillospiraceae bacterium]
MRSTFCGNLKPCSPGPLPSAIAWCATACSVPESWSRNLPTALSVRPSSSPVLAIDRKLTSRTIELVGCGGKADPPVSQALVRQVRQLNRDGIQLVDGLIAFKERLLRSVCSCSLFTSNYPLLIEHILREARLYRAHLMRLENRSNCSRQELCDSELFWNRIMMEHALFIRSLLDPSEEALVGSAGDFAADYKRLLEASAAANDKVMNGSSLALTQKFRDFKRASVDGIASCKIRSIILPLLADHVLREANHYLRLLES